MSEISNIELVVKSECSSDSTNGSDPTYKSEKFALYARYNFKEFGEIFSGFVFLSYLFESKEILETGKFTITNYKDISDLKEDEINEIIENDMNIRINKISGERMVNQKLNSIFHSDSLIYPISDGREKSYTILKG